MTQTTNHWRHVLFTTALVGLLATPSLAENVTLIERGVSRIAICAPQRIMAPNTKEIDPADARQPANEAEYQRQQLRAAVKDLAHYLHKMSGATVPIVAGSTPPQGKLPIYIGELGVAKFGKPQLRFRRIAAKGAAAIASSWPEYKQEFRVKVTPQGIGLIGETDLATSYAIYEVLDRLGCRWFMPSEWGECIPVLKTVALSVMDFSSEPGTLYRGIWQADPDYKRRNRLGGVLLQTGEALDAYIPAEVLSQHPDWVAVYKGKKVPGRAKWTKPEVAAAMADTILKQFDAGVYKRSVSLSPEDGLAFDESEDPRFDGGDYDPLFGTTSLTDRLLMLNNRVAAHVVETRPNVLFGMNVYAHYVRPPHREKLHPNIVPSIAPIGYSSGHPITDDGEPNNATLRRAIETWGKLASATGIYYYGWFLGEQTAPNPMITKWGIDVPFALKNNCLFFQPETTANFETSMHALWMGPRLAWNPNLKPADLVKEINTRFYGNAAQEMGQYWNYVDRIWIDTKAYAGAGHSHLKRFTPDRLKTMRELMDAALQKARTPEERFRIQMAHESLYLFEWYMRMRRELALNAYCFR